MSEADPENIIDAARRREQSRQERERAPLRARWLIRAAIDTVSAGSVVLVVCWGGLLLLSLPLSAVVWLGFPEHGPAWEQIVSWTLSLGFALPIVLLLVSRLLAVFLLREPFAAVNPSFWKDRMKKQQREWRQQDAREERIWEERSAAAGAVSVAGPSDGHEGRMSISEAEPGGRLQLSEGGEG